MKKKTDGKYRASITTRDFLQEDGVHYFSHSNAARVTNELNIKIELTFLVLTFWKTQVIDVKGAFLKGGFTDGENFIFIFHRVLKFFTRKTKYCI
jgi:hypothetical protein